MLVPQPSEKLPFPPTTFLPGSPERIAEMARRVALLCPNADDEDDMADRDWRRGVVLVDERPGPYHPDDRLVDGHVTYRTEKAGQGKVFTTQIIETLPDGTQHTQNVPRTKRHRTAAEKAKDQTEAARGREAVRKAIERRCNRVVA